MREVLNRLICNEIRRIGNGGNWKDQNLLSYGYRSKVDIILKGVLIIT
jgi:hypothetical protein